ncbi:MAG: ATP-binding cassette domain-containing protein [Candidatus Eisenbacteria sp.]|nr:ATP-binding cassette domain-containing protein [Candidatus Eisenbacteria bacterium]
MTTQIAVEHVYHRGRGAKSSDWILKDVSFSVEAGELLTIVGPSGAGKSTLLRLLAHLESPTQGRILLNQTPLDDIPLPDLRSRLGMVFQVPALFEGTVAENVLYGLQLRGASDPGRAREILDRVGLGEDLLEREAMLLSVGEQQRVTLARALVLDPDVLLIDEPTSALDPASTAHISRLIRDLNEQMGLTVVQISHDVHVARQCGGNVLLLVDGGIPCH